MNEETKSKTIHEDGKTLVHIELTKEQAFGLLIFHKRNGLSYHDLVKVTITDYLDRNLTDTEKAHVKHIISSASRRQLEGIKI